MSNQQREMQQIRRLIAVWISEIRLNNYESYYDINKVGEHLSRQLLNKIYDYELIDLNEVKSNFPGLDLGDNAKDLIAYQVTSRIDCKKVFENLETVVKNKYNNIFTGGIRFLILNDKDTVKFGPRAKKTPAGILTTFKMDQDIIYPQNLIKKIEDIYEKDADLLKFNEIKSFLEKELIPIMSGQIAEVPEAKMDNLASLLTRTLDKLSDIGQPELKISNQFFHGDLKPPGITTASERSELTGKLWKQINDVDAVWLQGAPAIGKTSLAVLLTKKSTGDVLWIECRDIAAEQLMEHILSLLTAHLKVGIATNYKEILERIFSTVVAGTFIVFNDLPDLESHKDLQDYFGQFLAGADVRNFNILITSNYALPERLPTLYDLNIVCFAAPPFEETDTEAVLLNLGASKEIALLLSGIITEVTQGHPLLIQSAAKFLHEHDWEVDDQIVSDIFSGKFGEVAEREIYSRILENTTDVETRELLYRLQCVIGEFSLESIQRLSEVKPALSHPAEKLSQLIGIWIQKNAEKTYQLSPLIKTLDGNISPGIIREINKQLGLEIIEKKNISQIDASKAILYFSNAEEFNQAAFVLAKVLFEFVRTPQLFFEWGFNTYWFNNPLPKSVLPLLKIQIRVFQISICFELKKDAAFLIADIQNILAKEDSGTFGQALSELMFFQVNLMTNSLIALNHLSKAYHALSDIAEAQVGAEENISSLELLNSIWIIFSRLNKKEEYEEWFRILKTFKIPREITDPSNELYLMAAVSIYRNSALKNKGTSENVVELLYWMIDISEEHGLYLFCVYSLKYLAKFLIEEKHDYSSFIALAEKYERIWMLNPIYKFLFYAEIGSQYFLAGDLNGADYYLSDIQNVELPAIYTEKVDYLIVYLQVAYRKKNEHAPLLAHKALETVLSSPNYFLEDKVKLYGESAIGLVNQNKLHEALNLYGEGYTLLLDNFNNNEEQQAIVIRYGNAMKYLDELLAWGEGKSFGVGKFVIPEPGYFYRTNEKLLADGFYFDERKFMGATILQSSFETIGDIEKAKQWAYKSIALSQELEDAKFIVILQDNLHYLIQDKQYRQAYNLMAHIEIFYTSLKKRAEGGEPLSEGLKQSLQNIKGNDLGMYFFILLPIALSFSLEVCNRHMHPEQYQQMIIDAFNSDHYLIKDDTSFSFARSLFEQIMINRVSYAKMQELLKSYRGEMQEIFYIIGCILLSGFTNATEAANLQLAVIVELDKAARGMSSMYRFFVVPCLFRRSLPPNSAQAYPPEKGACFSVM